MPQCVGARYRWQDVDGERIANRVVPQRVGELFHSYLFEVENEASITAAVLVGSFVRWPALPIRIKLVVNNRVRRPTRTSKAPERTIAIDVRANRSASGGSPA